MAETKAKAIEPEIKEADPMVRIKLPIVMGDSNKEDVVVWVNARRFLIKRGVPVDVPESVALILEQQEKMLQYSYDFEKKVARGN